MPEIFNNWFVFSSDTHRYETSRSEKGMLKVKSFKAKSHGKKVVTYNAINTWNSLQNQLSMLYSVIFLRFKLKIFEASLSENLSTLTHVSCFMLI